MYKCNFIIQSDLYTSNSFKISLFVENVIQFNSIKLLNTIGIPKWTFMTNESNKYYTGNGTNQ